jgi:autotransporter-associated beta strand protein
VTNLQIVNAPLLLEGNYTFTSGAASAAATLTFGGAIAPGPTTGTTTLTLTGSNTGNNTISGAVSDNGSAGTKLALAKTGTGLWIVSGVNTYTGDTTVSAGTLRFATAAGTPSVGAAATATVTAGATLELAGLVSDLGRAGGNRVHVVNNSAAPGVLVSGKNQVVGAIDGPGSVQINAGSDLTANHIIQTAIVIGGTSSTNRGLVTIDASDASGNPLDQSRGAEFAGSLAPPFPDGLSSDLASSSDGFSGAAAPVPEPATLLLALLGLALSGKWRRAEGPFQSA